MPNETGSPGPTATSTPAPNGAYRSRKWKAYLWGTLLLVAIAIGLLVSTVVAILNAQPLEGLGAIWLTWAGAFGANQAIYSGANVLQKRVER